MPKYIYDEEDKKVGKIVIGFLLVLLLFYFFIYFLPKKNNLINQGKYTIAKITRIIEMRGANDPEYEYEVNNVRYVSTEARIIQGTFNFTQNLIGKRYFVLFDSISPDNSCLLPLNPVPDKILQAPLSGWNHLPDGDSLLNKE